MKVIPWLLLMLGTLFSSSTHTNLLDPNLFDYDDGYIVLENHQGISVSPGNTYMLRLPYIDFIGAVDVFIRGDDNHIYVNETLLQENLHCYQGYDYMACRIDLLSTTNALFIAFTGGNLDQYLSYYGMHDFQLELGETVSSFIPFVPAGEPYFQGSQELFLDYRQAKPLNQIIDQHIQAFDNSDGDISHRIQVIDNPYSGNESTVGSYNVLLSVRDTQGNETQMVLTLIVFDGVAPQIVGPDRVSVEMLDRLALNAIVSQAYQFQDDYDGIITTFNILSTTYVLDTLGAFQATIEIEDSSGNTRQRTVFIDVVQTRIPTLVGPPFVQLYLTEDPSLETILALFEGQEAGGVVSLPVVLKHSNRPLDFTKEGQFTLTLETEDEQQNKVHRVIHLRIVDDVPPVFKFDDLIVVPLGTTLAEIDLFYLLMHHYADEAFMFDAMVVLEDGYTSQAHQVGIYPFKVQLTSQTGEDIIHQGRIQVTDVYTWEEPGKPTTVLWVLSALFFSGALWFKLKK